MKMHLKISSAKLRQFCPGGDELKATVGMKNYTSARGTNLVYDMGKTGNPTIRL